MLKILNPVLVVLLLNQVMTAIFHDALRHEIFEIMHMGSGFVLAGVATLLGIYTQGNVNNEATSRFFH